MRKFLGDFVYDCRTLVIPYMVLIPIVVVFFCTGHSNVAWFFGNVGSLFIMLANVVYVVAFHSRKRWAGVSWRVRLNRLLTFQR
jgi:hypothetical protein